MRRIAIDSSSTVDLVVDALRTEMFAGRWPRASSCARWSSRHLRRGAQHRPEALQVLVAEGLATRVRNRGVAVRQLTIEDVDDLYGPAACSRSPASGNTPKGAPGGARGHRNALASYEAEIGSGDPVRIPSCNLRFHAAVVAAGRQRPACRWPRA